MQRAAKNPLYSAFKCLDENLVIGFAKPKVITLGRPFLTGFAILELSKLYMYQMFYEQIRPRIPTARIGFSDTDSWLLALPGKTVEEALDPIDELMDYSNLDDNHPKKNNNHKAQLGYLKEENACKAHILEACLIRAKCYSLKCVPRYPYQTHDEIKLGLHNLKENYYNRCKGTKKSIVARLKFNDYLSVLKKQTNVSTVQPAIRSYAHDIYTIQQRKRMFRTFEDKTFVKNCGIHTLPYEHYSIVESVEKAAHCDICPLSAQDWNIK